MSLEQEPSFSALFLTDLELSDETSLLCWMNRPSVKDMVLGAGGSALVHILIGAAALLMPFVQAPPNLHGAFVTVSLVEMGGSKGGSCDTGSVEGASAGPQIEPSQPAEKQPEKAPPPVPPKPLKQVERVAAVAEKPVKKASPPAAVKPDPTQVVPANASERPPSDAPPSSPNAPPETAGTGATGGEGQGARGTGEGAGLSAAGGSSAGAGHHGGEFNADAVDKIPQAVHKVEPIYPPRAHKKGVCGKVVLRFLVEPDGRVTRPSIVEANPEGYFEQSALDAIRHWRFKPGIYRGKAVATWVVLPVQFKLTS